MSGGFVIVDKDTTPITNQHRARILEHPIGRLLLSLLKVEVGSSSFSLQPW